MKKITMRHIESKLRALLDRVEGCEALRDRVGRVRSVLRLTARRHFDDTSQ